MIEIANIISMYITSFSHRIAEINMQNKVLVDAIDQRYPITAI